MDDKKRLTYFLIIVVLIAGLSFTLYYGYEKGWIGNKGRTIPASTPAPIVEVVKYDGVYLYEGTRIKLYELADNRIFFSIISQNNDTEGYADKNGKTAVGEIFNKYTFTIKDNGIEFTTTDENLVQGTYTKESNYTKEDFYRDKYGDINLISSKYNGKFELEGATLYMYQSEEKKVRVVVEKGLSSSDISYDIMDDASLNGKIFEEEYSIKLEEDNLIFTTVKGDKTFDGTYKKTKALTIDDILANINA